jgi:hypothetical protein
MAMGAALRQLGAAAMGRVLMPATLAVVLAGCASQLKYVRTDGAPVDTAQQRATLAQCKGEGAVAVPLPNAAAEALDAARKEANVINACMARNGYIQAQ